MIGSLVNSCSMMYCRSGVITVIVCMAYFVPGLKDFQLF